MKLELKAKYLQYLSQKKQDEGFTLIELLVVIIIIGILSAIALPSFLNQANKAKQVEAKTYVGSMNRAQQAFFLENSYFSTAIGLLGLGISTSSVNYSYVINSPSSAPLNVTNQAGPIGTTKQAVLKSYIGGVFTNTVSSTSEATTVGVLCEANNPGVAPVTVTPNANPPCPTAWSSLAK